MKNYLLFTLFISAGMFLSAQDMLNNTSVLRLASMGFDSNVIRAKIETTPSNFDTSVSELQVLRDQGIPSDILELMIYKSAERIASGIYFENDARLEIVEPTVFSGMDGSAAAVVLTFGLAPITLKGFILNAQSSNVTKSNKPTFIFQFDNVEQGDFNQADFWFRNLSSPNEFALIPLKQKSNRRQLAVQRAHITGVSEIMQLNRDKIIPFDSEYLGNGKYRVTPTLDLSPGEYCFFYQGMQIGDNITQEFAFDFSVK